MKARAGTFAEKERPSWRGSRVARSSEASLDFSNAAIVVTLTRLAKAIFEGGRECEGWRLGRGDLRFADRESPGVGFPAMRVPIGVCRQAERRSPVGFGTA